MALNKVILSSQIKALIDELSTETENPEQARQKFADDLSTAIDSFIKSATVTSSVNTVVVGTSPSGPVTGTGTGTAISSSIT